MIPNAKISLLVEYILSVRDSGGIYSGVPTFAFDWIDYGLTMANPKSAIFHVAPDLKIFAGFRSR